MYSEYAVAERTKYAPSLGRQRGQPAGVGYVLSFLAAIV